MEEQEHRVVRAGQAWYAVDRCEPHGWALREAVVTRVAGTEVTVAQQGLSLCLDEHALRVCYASTAGLAWRRAEQRLVEKMDELRAARAAWAKG